MTKLEAYLLYLREWDEDAIDNGDGTISNGFTDEFVVVDQLTDDNVEMAVRTFGTVNEEDYIVHVIGQKQLRIRVVSSILPLVDSQHTAEFGGPFDGYVRTTLNIPGDAQLMYSRTHPETSI